jgi:hypothetical protein
MLKRILLGIVVLILVFVIYVALQPSTYEVRRQINISAPPDTVFALVNDFHKWDAWSPWAKLDPAMKTTYEGATAGPGAIYSWTGNDKVGEGRMTILDSRPNESVRIKLEFMKPFPSTSMTEFAMKGDGASTAVNWTTSGENNFIAKAALLMMGGMDKAMGPDFERGLAQMKAAAEAHR